MSGLRVGLSSWLGRQLLAADKHWPVRLAIVKSMQLLAGQR